VLGAGQGQVGHHVQAVAAAGRPPGHDADDHLGHEADQPLRLQHVQPAAAGLGVLVAVPAAHPLVAAGAERPAAVLRARAVAGEQHAADVGGQPGVLQDGDELVDGLRPEGVAHLGPVEGDPHDAGVDGAVVGEVASSKPSTGRHAAASKISETSSRALMGQEPSRAGRTGPVAPVLRDGALLSGPSCSARRTPVHEARAPSTTGVLDVAPRAAAGGPTGRAPRPGRG
jgi:hypothetical protein